MYLNDVKTLQKFKTSGFGSLLYAPFRLGREFYVLKVTVHFPTPEKITEKVKEDLFPREVTS